eukprot:TRINITY_DN21922_c0_g1_i2.p2 TRINITY_DN21922_c0_g1~~TRINITY_DN21922_c0_g1_i2.p2  ORF type:complete len:129 (+),score=17.82 TRINITY_DN21922_c0_g1_i2:195-581(+)
MAAQAAVGIGSTLVIPRSNRLFGIHRVYAGSLVLLTVCMCTAAAVPPEGSGFSIVLVAVTGVAYAVLNSSPFEIAELLIRGLQLEARRGKYTGLVASSLPLAQIVVGLFAGVAAVSYTHLTLPTKRIV